MTTLIPHQKQFVLGPAPVSVRPDWISARLAEQLVLSHCPKLRVAPLRSRDGKEYWLLGLAVRADVPKATIAEEFPRKTSDEIEDWTGFWAGKWALISAQCCWQDASGCLGHYYRKVDDAFWISSSPALLGEHLPGAPRSDRIPWQVTHRMGMDWIPAPLTTRAEVYKALPQRTINPVTGAIRPVRFAAVSGNATISEEALASAFKTIMINWAQEDFGERLIGLTAGLDTRTILAAASAAKLDLQACTFGYPEADRRDVALPPQLAASVGIPHRTITLAGLAPHPAEIEARAAAVSEHMDGATFHPVSASVADGLEAFMHHSGRTIAGGHVLGLGRCYNWKRFARAGFAETLPSADQLLDVFHSRAPVAPHFWSPEPRTHWKEAMQLWIDSLSDPVPLKLDWRDRFQLEQRVGAWNSGLERTMDLMDGTYFYPGNCLWVFFLLLRDPPEKRVLGSAQKRAIRQLAPRLSKFPVNGASTGGLKGAAKALLGGTMVGKLRSFANGIRKRRATLVGAATWPTLAWVQAVAVSLV